MRDSFKINKDEKMVLDKANLRESELYQEQLKYARARQIKINEIRIKQKKREIELKQKQIDLQKPIEKHLDFLDDTKPLILVQNDIDQLNLDVEDLEFQIVNLKKEQEKENV